MTNTHKLDLRLQNVPQDIWKDIAAIDELKGRWSASASLHPQVLTRLKRSVLITSTGASTRIEGARLSDSDIEKLMRGISIEKFADRDVQEVKGYFELLQNIFDSWQTLALKEKSYHPIITIGNFLVEFLQIHPFQDGNGRLSRILTNLLLLKEGYLYIPYVSHEKLIEDNKPDYYLVLRRSQKTFNSKSQNVTSWLQFFVKIILIQSQMAVGLLTTESIEKILSPIQLSVWNYLQK